MWIGVFFEVVSVSLVGYCFEKYSYDEFVISVNFCGLEDVWLDGCIF